MAKNESSASSVTHAELWAQCEELGKAVDKSDVGQTVTAVQHLILKYYDDVREQAGKSFLSAKRVAFYGFLLLVVTIVYVIIVDFMLHREHSGFVPFQGSMSAGVIGLVGGGIMEFVAGVQFVLYGKTSRQFGAFHICLERTHRYLLAYKIAEQMDAGKNDALMKIVCIMANAPMLTRQDIEGDAGAIVAKSSLSATAATP